MNARNLSRRLAQLYFALLGIASVYILSSYLNYGTNIFDVIGAFVDFGMAPVAMVAILLLPLLIVSMVFGEWRRHKERKKRDGVE